MLEIQTDIAEIQAEIAEIHAEDTTVEMIHADISETHSPCCVLISSRVSSAYFPHRLAPAKSPSIAYHGKLRQWCHLKESNDERLFENSKNTQIVIRCYSLISNVHQ